MSVERVFAGLFGEGAVGLVGFRDDHDAGREPVEAVNDTGPGRIVARRLDGAAMVHDGVDEGAGVMAGRGMNDEPRGFVDDEDIGVFEQDIERNVLRLGGSGRVGGEFEYDGVTGEHAAAGPFTGRAVDEGAVFLDHLLDVGTRRVLEHFTQKRVETEAVVDVVNVYFEDVGRFKGHRWGKYSRV